MARPEDNDVPSERTDPQERAAGVSEAAEPDTVAAASGEREPDPEVADAAERHRRRAAELEEQRSDGEDTSSTR